MLKNASKCANMKGNTNYSMSLGRGDRQWNVKL